MKILYKVPGEPLRSMVVPNELGVMQQLVDGYIESITLPDNLIVICNEEGKIRDMAKNFHVAALDDYIYGPALFMGADGEEFCSIKPEHEKLIRAYFDVFGTEGFNGK
jgi:hypothetical protein